MADYSRYKIETLIKMGDKAKEKYYELTAKSDGHWGDGMRLSKLPSMSAWEHARDRLHEIEAEIERRNKK